MLQGFCLDWLVPAGRACEPSQLWGLLTPEDVSNFRDSDPRRARGLGPKPQVPAVSSLRS